MGLAREKLEPGDIVAYFDNIQFPALLWNNTFSNRVLFAGAGVGYFDPGEQDACEMGDLLSEWGIRSAPLRGGGRGRRPTWKDVGVYNVENWGHIYSRVLNP